MVLSQIVMFLLVKAMMQMRKPKGAPALTAKECPYCKMQIPLSATRCPYRTAELPAGT